MVKIRIIKLISEYNSYADDYIPKLEPGSWEEIDENDLEELKSMIELVNNRGHDGRYFLLVECPVSNFKKEVEGAYHLELEFIAKEEAAMEKRKAARAKQKLAKEAKRKEKEAQDELKRIQEAEALLRKVGKL